MLFKIVSAPFSQPSGMLFTLMVAAGCTTLPEILHFLVQIIILSYLIEQESKMISRTLVCAFCTSYFLDLCPHHFFLLSTQRQSASMSFSSR